MANINLYKCHMMHIYASSRRFRDSNVSNVLPLQIYVKVSEYKVYSDAIRWQMPTSIKCFYANSHRFGDIMV